MTLHHSLTPFELTALERKVLGVTFQDEPMRPWWVGKCPVVANAVHWIPGVEAAAVYQVRGRYVVVVAWQNPSRPGGVAWASADLGEVRRGVEASSAQQAC